MILVTKEFSFEACHHLPFYEGPCHNLHGHSYKLEVSVTGTVRKDVLDPKCGMIIDFKDLKALVNKEVINKLDHRDLNDIYSNPTAEIMVEDIAKTINRELPKDIQLVSCKLWETADSYAEYRPE